MRHLSKARPTALPLGADVLGRRTQITRRGFAALLVGTALWPRPALTQQAALPAIGYLRSTPAAPFAHIFAAFVQGLSEAGFVVGRDVTIEERYADNQPDRLPALVADLVRLQVAVIVGNGIAISAAKAVTATTPMVFVVGGNPVRSGFVASLSRPGGNLTGATFFGGAQIGAKRLELLVELVPKAAVIAVLMDPNYPSAEAELPNVEAAGRAIGRRIVVVQATGEGEYEAAFARMMQAGAGALLLAGGPVFTSQRRHILALAARHSIPAVYDQRDFVESGGLMSYSGSFTGAYRQAGIYAGRILKGAVPAELPVLQPTEFSLVINLRTARALGIVVPPSILLRADEVIE